VSTPKQISPNVYSYIELTVGIKDRKRLLFIIITVVAVDLLGSTSEESQRVALAVRGGQNR